MKTKSKIKNKKKSKAKAVKRVSRPRIKKYPTHYLALILAVTLLLEGVLFGITTGSDWKNASQILDVSSGVSEVQIDLTQTFQPMSDLVSSIDQFYQLSAIQMSQLLDLSDSGVGSEVAMIYNGVSEFYQQASIQMAQVLDFSSSSSWPAKVAGISIKK